MTFWFYTDGLSTSFTYLRICQHDGGYCGTYIISKNIKKYWLYNASVPFLWNNGILHRLYRISLVTDENGRCRLIRYTRFPLIIVATHISSTHLQRFFANNVVSSILTYIYLEQVSSWLFLDKEL